MTFFYLLSKGIMIETRGTLSFEYHCNLIQANLTRIPVSRTSVHRYKPSFEVNRFDLSIIFLSAFQNVEWSVCGNHKLGFLRNEWNWDGKLFNSIAIQSERAIDSCHRGVCEGIGWVAADARNCYSYPMMFWAYAFRKKSEDWWIA